MTDIVFLSIPIMSTANPASAPAVLKGAVEAMGFKAKAFDFNILLKNFLKDYPEQYLEIITYFQIDIRGSQKIINFDSLLRAKKKQLSSEAFDLYQGYLNLCIQKINDVNPIWVGISVFSYNSVIPAIDFMQNLRNQSEHKYKIILGGLGLGYFNFVDFCLTKSLANEVIYREGEKKITQLLSNHNKIKSAQEDYQVRDITNIPFANYEDYELTDYGKNYSFYLTGSRGCVRDCSFCDIRDIWPQFKYRSGKEIAKEIEYYHKRYNQNAFYFTDSLMNGALKPFEDFCDAMVKMKEEGNLSKDIRITGQFICRKKERFPIQLYKKMMKAGIKEVFVGVESGSNKILEHMGKNHTVDDLDFMMEQFEIYNIKCLMLMLIGFPTEDANDFQETLSLLKRYKRYSDNGIITGVNLGKTMAIIPGSPIAKNQDRWQIKRDKDGNWYSALNPSNTASERIRRRIAAQRLCEQTGHRIRLTGQHIRSLKEMILQKEEYV